MWIMGEAKSRQLSSARPATIERMDLTNLDQLRAAMAVAGMRANKALGQHFLVDREALEAVIEASGAGPNDTVLEVGPGLGVMTRPLTERAGKVVAVEADERLAQLLRHDAPENLEVVTSDILKFDFSGLPRGYKVAANIPYYLTSKLVRLLLENENPPSAMALLIQKEVAARIAAAPGDMSILAVSVQYYAEAEITRLVPPKSFWPAPEVDSAVIRIVRRPEPLFPADPARLFRLVKAGFGEKRKQLKNSLSGGLRLPAEEAAALLTSAGLSPTARAQELSLVDWERLYASVEARSLL